MKTRYDWRVFSAIVFIITFSILLYNTKQITFIQNLQTIRLKRIIPPAEVEQIADFFKIPPYCYYPISSYRIKYFSSYPSDLTLFPISPVPGDKEFINFTKEEALKLVTNKTILFYGDSTSRRITRSFCKFLHNPNVNLNLDYRHKKDHVCNEKDVKKVNLYLSLKEIALAIPGVTKFINIFIKEALEFQYFRILNLESSVGDSLNMFIQIYPLHINYNCYENFNGHGCGYDSYFKNELKQELTRKNINKSNLMTEMACATTINFILRATEEYSNIIRYNSSLSNINLHIHAMTNVPRMINFSKPEREQNDMQYILAKAVYSISYRTEMCQNYFHYLSQVKKYSNLTISFIDQTTWPLEGSHWTKPNSYDLDKVSFQGKDKLYPNRHACLVGDIHVKKSVGQRLRVMSFLNSIL